jgi:CRP/FNR family transcriptional regulator
MPDFRLLQAHVPAARRILHSGQALFRAGQQFHSLGWINAGLFKTTLVGDDGREQVTGFAMRGEWLGIEAIGAASHACTETALDDSEVWLFPYEAIAAAATRLPQLQALLAHGFAAEIRRDRARMLMLSTLRAESRVAAFLVELSARRRCIGLDDRQLALRMTRAEIGSYLGLSLETVTRAMTSLDQAGCIAVKRRNIEILDSARLRGCTQSARLH